MFRCREINVKATGRTHPEQQRAPVERGLPVPGRDRICQVVLPGGDQVRQRLPARVHDVVVQRRLKTKNGRKNVKSAPYRPILSANRTRQRPAAVYTNADPAQTGQNGGS